MKMSKEQRRKENPLIIYIKALFWKVFLHDNENMVTSFLIQIFPTLSTLENNNLVMIHIPQGNRMTAF